MVKVQVRNGTAQVCNKSHIPFAREPKIQVADGVVLAIDISPEDNAVGGILVLADRNKAVTAIRIAHLVHRSRGIDVLGQNIIRRIQVGACAYRLQVFVVFNLEWIFSRTGPLHGTVCGKRLNRKQRQYGRNNEPKFHNSPRLF